MRNTWWHLLAAPLRQVEDAPVRGMCDIIGVTSLTDQQRVQVQLPQRHGGMGLRRFSEDVATAARLSPTQCWRRDVTRLCPSEAQWGFRHTRLWRGFRRHGLP